ncbi:hypothetical protein SOM11_03220 [Frigoribacterium sp. CFBP9039]|uniref:PH-like domain-containing protein n=1 Tax=Frigoribacterium TaxID=96492 RepID=UPI001785E93D|nr:MULTISPECIES: hypothetical protein [Frigoribacterium]MBD8703440.1 hypothetical protein [Frigoribacterium sp. CFBP 13712]MCJ0699558.1 hypothetical protein [Frigoribacterium faeni]MDY0891053.1 hypothetical protein [Frigoribacterium sp. CFBP9030]MDY0944988.1 hypothetical protein [Frigoribacterium sp. CFBP9039]
MTYWWIGLGVLVLLAALLWQMARSWRARGRRQSDIALPEIAPDGLGTPSIETDGFYVATSRAGDPLDRIVIGGLGFRGRAGVSVHVEGVRLEIAGEPAKLIRASSIRDVGRATWTIDRVVEEGGLVLIAWTLGETDVDTYLRIVDDPTAVVDGIRGIIPTAPRAGTSTGENL